MKAFIDKNKAVSFSKNAVAGAAACVNATETEVALCADDARFDGGFYAVRYRGNVLDAKTTVRVKGNALHQYTTFTAKTACTLTQAASAKIEGVCYDEAGISARLGDGSLLVHYCISRWQGEGQWRTATPEDLGIYAATGHAWERSWQRFQSISSWSTATYFPIVIIEDTKQGEAWFFTVECGRSWFIELSAWGGIEDMKSFCVKLGGADEQLGFCKKMQVGEEYRSADCAYGVVKGGFEEAVQALVGYWRESTLAQGGCPLVFNDYMNCNWANESRERLLPLIDKAAELGCEVFCLDDGWQEAQGIWFPADEKLGEGGLQGIFSRIQARGMKLGVWFEFETLPLRAESIIGAEDCFLFRNGEMVAPNRPLANFRSPKVVAYLKERVAALYEMGVRFIKNDHNNAEHLGCTIYGESPAEGLEENERAFLSFIDGLRAAYPDLILENCASGGMRADYGTLKHFHVQSTSDQEDYLRYPSILSGSLALMPPEKAGIWCYPYPLAFNDREQGELSPERISAFADGEQTAFNVVNGFMGNLYLSGKLHQADAYNARLLKEGLDLYKIKRDEIFKSVPVYPCGRIRLSAREPYAMGVLSEKRDKLLLAVWNLSNDAARLSVDLSKYGMEGASLIYPAEIDGVTYAYQEGVLSVTFSKGNTARLFELKIASEKRGRF